MALYKHYNYDQQKLLPISFSRQILPGTFEYTLSHIIDHALNLSRFDARYANDETGAPAYDPAILLKIVLYAYARGITSSREIEQSCRENVIFMALSTDSQPHFTTIANFISSMRDEIKPLFFEIQFSVVILSATPWSFALDCSSSRNSGRKSTAVMWASSALARTMVDAPVPQPISAIFKGREDRAQPAPALVLFQPPLLVLVFSQAGGGLSITGNRSRFYSNLKNLNDEPRKKARGIMHL